MISRELQVNQPILSALPKQTVSFSNQASNESSFDAYLSQKQTERIDSSQTVSQKQVDRDQRGSSIETYSKKNEEKMAVNQDKQKTQKTSSASSQKETNSVESQKEASDRMEADKALKKLKEMLKKKTGLSDEMIDQLLQMMPMDMNQLAQMVDFDKLEAMDFSQLINLANDKQALEVNQLLDQPMQLNDLKQLLENFTSVIQSFEDILKVTFVSQNQISNEDIAKAFAEALGSEDLKVQVSEGQGQSKEIDVRALVESMGNASDKVSLETSGQQSLSEESMTDSNESQMDQSQVSKEEKVQVASVDQSKNDDQTNETKTTVEVKGDQIVVQTTTGPNQTNVTTSSQVIQTMTLPKADVMNQVLEAVKNNMSLKLGNEGSQMIVKLQPEELGKVDVKVSIHKGIVLAEIHVENEAVKATVESNLDHLKQSLSQKGYQVNQLSVGLNSGQKEHSGDSVFDQYEQMKKNQKSAKVDALDDDILNDLAQEVSRLTSSTIDYFA